MQLRQPTNEVVVQSRYNARRYDPALDSRDEAKKGHTFGGCTDAISHSLGGSVAVTPARFAPSSFLPPGDHTCSNCHNKLTDRNTSGICNRCQIRGIRSEGICQHCGQHKVFFSGRTCQKCYVRRYLERRAGMRSL